MTEWALDAGPFGLFALSFLAATLLPFSSEVALVGGIAVGIPVSEAVVACSLGNCLACSVNYGLGRLFRERSQARIERSDTARRTLGWMDRYGPASLLLSWAPVVGDPLTVVAGVARVSWGLFAAIVFPLRVGRYLLLAGLV